jgi:hypothetical protein
MKLKIILILLISFTFFSCTTLERIQDSSTLATNRITIREIEQQISFKHRFSYLGFGLSTKGLYEVAKTKALDDLASQIEVRISSTISIQEYEGFDGLSSSFSQNITPWSLMIVPSAKVISPMIAADKP